MITLELYKFFFYFCVIWLVIGIVVTCTSIVRHFIKKRVEIGDHKQQ
jgi:hypothetical protein